MDPTSTFDATDSCLSHLECYACGEVSDVDGTTGPCPACGGILDPQYDLDAFDVSPETWARRGGSMWKYRELLPVQEASAVVSMGEGVTPLIECPRLAATLNRDSDRDSERDSDRDAALGRLFLKDEGQNPTNTFKDRGLSAAISCANERGVTEVALPSAGNAGQSASAYAARAGMDCHVFLNHQAGDVKKDLVEAHGAHLHLSEGKIDRAGAAFAEAREANGWDTVATFQTPYRHDGKKTMGFELYEAFGWSTPDHVVYPTGGGVGLIGIWKAYQQLHRAGWIDDDPPALHVAQSTGTAPVVEAIEAGATEHTPWEDPETVARGVEIPDPGASPWILEAVAETDGTGVAVDDGEAIDAALSVASRDGVEMCVTAAVALAGAMRLAREGAFGPEEDVVVVNTGAGCKTAGRLGDAARERLAQGSSDERPGGSAH